MTPLWVYFWNDQFNFWSLPQATLSALSLNFLYNTYLSIRQIIQCVVIADLDKLTRAIVSTDFDLEIQITIKNWLKYAINTQWYPSLAFTFPSLAAATSGSQIKRIFSLAYHFNKNLVWIFFFAQLFLALPSPGELWLQTGEYQTGKNIH